MEKKGDEVCQYKLKVWNQTSTKSEELTWRQVIVQVHPQCITPCQISKCNNFPSSTMGFVFWPRLNSFGMLHFFFFHFFFNFTKWCKMFPLITDEKQNNFYVMIWREKKVQIYNQSENSCGNLWTATRMFNLLAVSVLHPSLHWSEPHDWDGSLDYSTNTKQVHHLASAAYSTTL